MSTTNKGYLLGKLFALFEQEGVIDPQDYSAASVNPALLFVPAIARLSAKGRSQVILETMNELPADALNVLLSSEDQASFPMGYYQQKARGVRVPGGEIEGEEQFTAQLLLRLEPTLKEWTMQRGGSKFVRSLLRAQRASELS